MKKFAIIAGLLAAVGMGSSAHAATVNVGVQLALLVDVSGSIDSTEFALQKTGYVNAFNNATVQADIAAVGGIAVTLVYFDQGTYQSVGWTVLTNAAQSTAFATAINNTTRPGSGNTSPTNAINFVAPQMKSGTLNVVGGVANTVIATSVRVIDVSGDGEENVDTTTQGDTARTNALGTDGVNRINGLTIGTDDNVVSYYATHIKGGTGSFTVAAATFNDFGNAIITKLTAEITGVTPSTPLPSAAIMGSALMSGLALIKRRVTKKA